MLNDWFKQNAWNIIITAVAIVIAWSNLSTRVSAVEASHDRLEATLQQLTNLTERIIVVEERQSNIQATVSEIKSDVKDIKDHFLIDGKDK
ncbi:MAG: type VI secretion system protein [Podoviridae sp. ctg2L5]|nr:MAG: type VI secretion system protein [Podoviridae sp. ctg2L5]